MTNIQDIFRTYIIYLKNGDTVMKLCVYYEVETTVAELPRYML